MTYEEIQLLRRLAFNESGAVSAAMSGEIAGTLDSLDPRTASLVRIATLFGLDSEPSTLRWAVEEGIAAGVEDSDILHAVVIVAPIIGFGRMTSAVQSLLEALDIDIMDD